MFKTLVFLKIVSQEHKHIKLGIYFLIKYFM